MTLEQLASATGIDTGNLSRIEHGKQRSPEAAEKIVRFFGRHQINELQILYPERYPEAEQRQRRAAGGGGR
jgi:putative transcriptional regulator